MFVIGAEHEDGSQQQQQWLHGSTMDHQVLAQWVPLVYQSLGGNPADLGDNNNDPVVSTSSSSSVDAAETGTSSVVSPPVVVDRASHSRRDESIHSKDDTLETDSNATHWSKVLKNDALEKKSSTEVYTHRPGSRPRFRMTSRLPFLTGRSGRRNNTRSSPQGFSDMTDSPTTEHLLPQHSPDMEQATVQSLFRQLDDLQTLLQNNLLNVDDNSAGLPIDFASHADSILECLTLLAPPNLDPGIAAAVQSRLHDLFQQHLDKLRDHFGRMYETLLDHNNNQDSPDAALRARVVRSFRNAAHQAVPQLARPSKPRRRVLGKYWVRPPQARGRVVDCDYNDAVALAGLESDLDAMAELRRGLVDDDDDAEARRFETPWSRRRQRILRLGKRLAARGLMLGVNYLQGWLAWQGIKRTALERERNFPKFPLF